MSPKLLILAIGVGFSSLSFAQSPADIRAELTSLNQTLHSMGNLSTASRSTKDSLLNQLIKIQSEVSNVDLPKERCAGNLASSSSCAGMKRDLQKRISTAIASAKRVDRYSAILIEQALVGMDTDLVALNTQPGLTFEEEEEKPKPRKKHTKLVCTPSPPNAVLCDGELYKKDNSMVSGDAIKAASDKALDESPMSADVGALGSSKAD